MKQKAVIPKDSFFNTDNLLEQLTNITKASAYEIVSKQAQDLTEENARLKERVKYLQDLIKEYTGKMLVNLSGGKVDEFLKEQITDPENDIPEGLYQKPGIGYLAD